MVPWALLLSGLLAMASSAVAQSGRASVDDHAQDMLGGLEWGMRPPAVFAVIEGRLREQLKEALHEARHDAIAQDRLLSALRRRLARIKKDFVVFDGRVSGWDVSAVGPEFRRGTGEAMLVYDDERARNYCFFMRGRLWKLYREYKPDAFAGADFDALAPALQSRFGVTELEAGKRLPDSPLTRWLRWQGGQSTVVAIDRGSQVAIVLSDNRVGARLASLRRGALPRGRRQRTVVDAVIMTAEEREAFRYGEASAQR